MKAHINTLKPVSKKSSEKILENNFCRDLDTKNIHLYYGKSNLRVIINSSDIRNQPSDFRKVTPWGIEPQLAG